MKVCPECGDPRGGREKFCRSCGFPLAAASEPLPARPAPVPEPEAAPRRVEPPRAAAVSPQPSVSVSSEDFDGADYSYVTSRGLVRGFLIFVILPLVIFGGVVAYGFMKPTPQKQMNKAMKTTVDQATLNACLRDLRSTCGPAIARLAPDEKGRWQAYIHLNAKEFLVARDTTRVCSDARALSQHGIWPSERQNVLDACNQYDEARKALKVVEDANRKAGADYDRLYSDVRQAKSTVEETSARVNRILGTMDLFHGWNHGSIGDGLYEISAVSYGRPVGERGVLRMTRSSFRSQGQFEMYVRGGGTTEITWKNGRVSQVPLLIEVDTSDLELARGMHRAALSRLMEAEGKASRASKPRLQRTVVPEARVDEAASKIEGLLSVAAAAPVESKAPAVAAKKARASQDEAQARVAASPEISGASRAIEGMAETRDPAVLRSLMEAVCTGTVSASQGSLSCNRCPRGAGHDSPPLVLKKAYVGALSRPGQNEAVVGFDGCAQGFNFEGSTAFLRRGGSGAWEMASFHGELASDACRSLAVNGQRLLLCEKTTIGGGDATTEHYFIGAEQDLVTGMLVMLEDSSGACRYEGEFGRKVDEIVVADVTGDGKEEVSLLISVETGHHLFPRDFERDCEALDEGLAVVHAHKEALVFRMERGRLVQANVPAATMKHERVRAYGTSEPPIPDVSRDVAAMLALGDGDEALWPIYQRRLSALRHARQMQTLSTMTLELAGLFPERAARLYVDLAEACEEARDYGCAARAYMDGLSGPDHDARLLGRAAWFFVTAPAPHGDAQRAMDVLVRARHNNAMNGVAVMAHAERLMQQNKADLARQVLADYLKSQRSDVARDYLDRLDSGSLELSKVPRDEVPRMQHKVPAAWQHTIPTGSLTEAEKLFAVELKAIEERGKGNHARALALYFEALGRAEVPEDRLVFLLGVGRTFEAAGRHDEALALYRTIVREMPDSADGLNRLAWFLLTTKSAGHRNLEEGTSVARRAVAMSHSRDPSVLDTLAEAYIANGDRREAANLLERCIELDPTREYYQTRLASVR